ncbi:recombinase family protein [Streptomyces malaysiensis]|nr:MULTISPECIES: recombinase family protein [Streptomyces]UHH19770.1 recombinase family protein [Streptomyces sp. HNM0561]
MVMGTQSAPLATGNEALTEQLRGVRAVRLSVLTDETTSPDRQRGACDTAADALGISFDGREAVDLDVSASKTNPWERPQLGAWLQHPDSFGVLVWWRFDRAIRSMADMYELAKWSREHRKMLVFAEGIGGGRLVFDFRNPLDPIAELMMVFFAFAAQVEAANIRDRVLGAQAAMRGMPLRWRGSRPPYGYMPAPLSGGGWTLVPDPDAVEVIERIIRELLSGKTASAIAVELNGEGMPSPRDHWALKKGRKTGGKTGAPKGRVGTTHERFRWNADVIRKVLTSLALIGWKTHRGKPVRDEQGNPVMATTEPILTRSEHDALCALFVKRAAGPRERKDSTESLLLRVIHCASCDGRMYVHDRSRKNPLYGCSALAQGRKCEERAYVREDWSNEYVERRFLEIVGPIEVTEVREIPGYDPTPEIRATLAEFEEHQKQEGRQKSNAAREAWQRRADALDSRLALLEATPKVEPRRETRHTGRTYADEWRALDNAGRRRMLVSAGVRLMVTQSQRRGAASLDESRVSFSLTGGDLDEAIEELHAIRVDESELAA